MKNFQKPSKKLIVKTLQFLAAKNKADNLRPTIRGIQSDILAKHQFSIADEWVERGMTSFVVTENKDSYLLADEDFNTYFTELNAIMMENYGVKDGYCPLLMAEDVQRNASREMIDCACKLWSNVMEGVTVDDLTCNLDNYHNFESIVVEMITGKKI